MSATDSSNDPTAARAFILARLGLSGPLWPAERAGEKAKNLGMIQIDSIRVNGLRKHEIAWAARMARVPVLLDGFASTAAASILL